MDSSFIFFGPKVFFPNIPEITSSSLSLSLSLEVNAGEFCWDLCGRNSPVMLLRADSGREISAPARPLLLLLPPSPLLGRSSLDLLSVKSPREPVCTCSPERSAVGSFCCCFFVCFPSCLDSGGLFSARGTPLLPLLDLVAALPSEAFPLSSPGW